MNQALVLLPSYNESKTLPVLIPKIFAHDFVHVLVIDDSSPDGTAAIVQDLQKEYEGKLFLLQRPPKSGRGTAVIDGFKYAKEHGYECVFEMDSDCSHQPSEMPQFYTKITEGNDLVIGSRYTEGGTITGWPLSRRLLSFAANLLERIVLRMGLTDYTNGYRCYSNKAIDVVLETKFQSSGFIVLSEIAYSIYKRGLLIAEVPCEFINRTEGESNMSFDEMYQGIFFLFSLRYPRLAKHAGQGFRYIIVGATGTIIDLGSLTVFIRVLQFPSVVAFTCSTILAVTFIFFANKHYAFRSGDTPKQQELIKFIAVYTVAIVLNTFCSQLFYMLGAHYLLAKIFGIIITIFWNYTLLHTFVFRRKSTLV